MRIARAADGHGDARIRAHGDRRVETVLDQVREHLDQLIAVHAHVGDLLGGELHPGGRIRASRSDALRISGVQGVHTLCGSHEVRELEAVRETEDAPLVFHALPTPTRAEVADVARRTADRIEHILKAHGRSLDPALQDAEPPALALTLEEPGLAACYAAAAQGVSVSGDRAGQTTLRLVVSQDAPATGEVDGAEEPVAEVRGINVHAKQLVDGRDRKEPHDLLTRLVAAVPPPNFHLLRYFGVLSSHSALRAEVVPKRPKDTGQSHPPPCQGDQLSLLGFGDSDDEGEPRHPRSRWGWLLKHVFQQDVDTCDRCGGPMRWVEAATTPDAIARLMASHGLAPERPPRPRRAAAAQVGQLPLPFGA